MRLMLTICSLLSAAVAFEGSSAAATPGDAGNPAAHIRIDFSDRERAEPGGTRMPHVSFSQPPGPRVSLSRVVPGRLMQPQAAPAAPTPQKLPKFDKAAIGVLGGLCGFFGGAAIGYGIDRHLVTPHGGGDDPWMTGFLVGGVIGAIALPVILITLLGR
jgi:hypothetical protein